MSIVVFCFMVICGAVLQAIFPAWAIFGGVRPPVLPSLMLYYALTRERWPALGFAFAIGLVQDAMCFIPLGYSSACFCLVACCVNYFRDRLYVRHWITHATLGAVGCAAISLMLFVLLRGGSYLGMPLAVLPRRVIAVATLGVITGPVVFSCAELLEKRLGLVPVGRVA